VRGQAEPVEVELKFSRHGPVFWEDPAGNRAVAIRWTGTEPGTAGYLGSLALNEATSWDGFVAAMSRWKIPSENIIYADVEGNIGWIPAGLMPIRENWSGLFPVPGHTGKYEWSGFRGVDQLPRIYNPREHYVATANHNIRPAKYPHDLGFDWTSPYRISRIHEVLRQQKKFTIEDFKLLQHEETSLPARQLQAMLAQLPAGGSDKFEQARTLLADWDCVLRQDSGAAALFEVWFRQLEPKLLKKMGITEHAKLIESNLAPETMFKLLEAQTAALRGEVLKESLETAMDETVKLLGENSSQWRWGALHTISFEHPLANSAARREVFNRGPVGRGGDGYTPNATGGSGFSQGSGASYRHILDLEDWDRSVFTSTPGQSGQPGSPHYDDLLQLWANHEYAPLVFSREAVEQNTSQKLILSPGTN
jgi:penicillin amidase